MEREFEGLTRRHPFRPPAKPVDTISLLGAGWPRRRVSTPPHHARLRGVPYAAREPDVPIDSCSAKPSPAGPRGSGEKASVGRI